MIRFVDMTEILAAYGDPMTVPAAAFFDTITDSFVGNAVGQHVFYGRDEVAELVPSRCATLVPDGFWKSVPRNERG